MAERGGEAARDNEQLEFLGDSVLGFVVSEALVETYPSATEGQLSRWKSYLVSAAHLHRCAQTIRLGEYLLLGRGEEQNGGRERKTLLANALEAVIAAIYLDGQIEPARAFIRRLVLSELEDLDDESFETSNSKSALQEWTQSLGAALSALCDGRNQRSGARQAVYGRGTGRRPVATRATAPIEKGGESGSRTAADRSAQVGRPNRPE